MAQLSRDERLDIERKLHDPRWRARLERVQNAIQAEFEKYRVQSETLAIRAVVPRHPIKHVGRVTSKIEENRETNSRYSLDSVEDLIGIKVLCPYPSDVRKVISWMQGHPGFLVRPKSITAARRRKKGGYRGYHFIVQLRGPLAISNEDLMGLSCEVQVKTMLEESWDAKTHDVTYRHETQINRKLLRMMKHLSDQLASLDAQSEDLKSLILERETEERRRKEVVATLHLYQSQPLFKELLSKIPSVGEGRKAQDELRKRKFTSTSVRYLLLAIQEYRQKGILSTDLCRMAGLVAIYAPGQHIDVWALDVCDEFIKKDPELPSAYLVKGSVCWALDRLDDAIEATEIGIQKAQVWDDKKAVADGKGDFAYWVGEKAWAGEKVEPELLDRAKQYIKETMQLNPANSANLDTKGFLLITTGETKNEIEEGKKAVKEALEANINSPLEKLARAFYERHERIAQLRLAILKG